VDTNEAEEKSDQKAKWTPSIGVLGCAGVLVGGLIVLFFVSSIIGTPDTPLLARFSAIDRWAGFFANLVVVFYVFPTFKLTKDRAFLYLGFVRRLRTARWHTRRFSFTTPHAISQTLSV
jgi:hypothetical protein